MKRLRLLLPALAACLLGSGCASTLDSGVFARDEKTGEYKPVKGEPPSEFFTSEIAAPAKAFATPEEVRKLSQTTQQSYRLGPGDKFAFLVRGRPDISREDIIVSPDGECALPRVGILNVSGKSIAEITDAARKSLSQFYDEPDVTLVMQEYNNNKVFVLGRVANPGAVNFKGHGTLLEALSLAGGLPADTQKSFLSRCMIIRGDEMVMWIDLKDLLENGNMALNARLVNNDIIFIPMSEDQTAYVMGQVTMPGVLVLRSQMTLLDAIMSSGGMTRGANQNAIFLVRTQGGKGVVEQVDMTAMLAHGDLRKNYVLKDGDIVYVSERGSSRFNYFMSEILPTLKVIDFSIQTAESFGAMAELRYKLWGQEGFVTSGSPQ